jgi:thiosulfate/3-mercaptopyruvate sulfurtransferase
MSRDPVIEPAALPSLGAVRLLDVRAVAPFASDHPARAVRIPIEVWEEAARAKQTAFENVHYWERAIADLGVDGHVPAVVMTMGE